MYKTEEDAYERSMFHDHIGHMIVNIYMYIYIYIDRYRRRYIYLFIYIYRIVTTLKIKNSFFKQIKGLDFQAKIGPKCFVFKEKKPISS